MVMINKGLRQKLWMVLSKQTNAPIYILIFVQDQDC